MRIGSRQVKGFSALRTVNRLGQALRTRAARHEAVNSPAALRTLSTAMPPAGKHAQPKTGRAEQRDEGATNSRTQGSSLSARALKYAVYLAAGGYAYIEIVNDFPLSTTSLHDGKRDLPRVKGSGRLRLGHENFTRGIIRALLKLSVLASGR